MTNRKLSPGNLVLYPGHVEKHGYLILSQNQYHQNIELANVKCLRIWKSKLCIINTTFSMSVFAGIVV